MSSATQMVRFTWKTKAPVAVGGAMAGFFAMRWWFYRPVMKKYPGDRVVPVDRSGGGL